VYTYTWNRAAAGPNPVTGLNAGSYTIVVTDANNCTASATASINQPTAIVLNPVVTDVLFASVQAEMEPSMPTRAEVLLAIHFLWSDGQNYPDRIRTGSGYL
jgi:hypothetical protein